jgi:hypothetical protein
MRELLNADENAAAETRFQSWAPKMPGTAAAVPGTLTQQVA